MNIVDFKVPILIDSDAEIIKWYKSENDNIFIGEMLLELEVEKVIFAVESEYAGKIISILKKENDRVKVGDILCKIEIAGTAAD